MLHPVSLRLDPVSNKILFWRQLTLSSAKCLPILSSGKERTSPFYPHERCSSLPFQKLVKTSPSKRKNRALLAAMIQCAEGQSYFSPEGILAPPPSASDDKDVETLPVARTISRMTLHEWEVYHPVLVA